MTITVTTGTHSSDLSWVDIIADYCQQQGIDLAIKLGVTKNQLQFAGSEDSLQDLLDHFNKIKEGLTNKH